MALAAQGYTAILLLVFFILEAEVLVKAQGKYDCQRLDKLEYCQNSSRIRVTKDKKDYQVRLCANDQCMSDTVGDMNLKIRCMDVCDVCKSLPGQNECKEAGYCEEQVDKFFDEYCSSASTVTIFSEKIVGTDCTPSSQIGGQVSPVPESILQTTGGDTPGSGTLVVVLGALLGLSMLLLAVVIIGWICTCTLMKKREKSDNFNQSEIIESTEQNRTTSESIRKTKRDENDDDDDEERYFKNPTYEGTSNKNSTSSATYETVNLSDSTKVTIENEQMYAVPDKQWKANGTYIF